MSITRQWLLAAILAIFPIIPTFADEGWIIAETDKTQYSTGESLVVTGFIMERKMPVIAMSVYDPDGMILSANSIELQEDDSFSKTISLDSPFYDKSGIYQIDLAYGKNSEQITFEVTSQIQEQELPIPKIIPEVIFLTTDKTTYQDNEFITISGMVSAIGDPTILVGIYDPSDIPTGFYTPQISSDSGFSVSFLAKSGINFKTAGTYSVKAHYGTSKYVTDFAFVDTPTPTSQATQSNQAQNEQASNSVTQTKPTIVNKPKPPIEKPNNNQAETKIVEFKPKPQTPNVVFESKQEEKKDASGDSDNLTVEDVELGKILNEITLSCDATEYLYSIAYYDGMGPALMRLCNYDQAISYFDQSLIKKPNNVEVITNKGSALAKLGQLDLAIAHYDLALGIDPMYLPAMNNKASVLAELGKLENAIEIYNLVLEEDPSYTTSQVNLQKAKEKLDENTSISQTNSLETSSMMSVKVEESAKIETAKMGADQTSQPSNIIAQIGNIFASFFGLLG